MTRLLEKAMEAAGRLSSEEQDELARTILEIVGLEENEPIKLTPEEREAIRLAREAYRRGEVATEDQVAAVLSKYAR